MTHPPGEFGLLEGAPEFPGWVKAFTMLTLPLSSEVELATDANIDDFDYLPKSSGNRACGMRG